MPAWTSLFDARMRIRAPEGACCVIESAPASASASTSESEKATRRDALKLALAEIDLVKHKLPDQVYIEISNSLYEKFQHNM